MFCIFLLLLGTVNAAFASTDSSEKATGFITDEHSLLSNSNVYPYVAAILKKSVYISAGALIDDKWVLTAADALYLMSGSLRTLRVRLGSINNKKGGFLIPVMYFEIHPYFDDSGPEFDIALIRLSQPVHFTPQVFPIKLLKNSKTVTSTHFLVTAWQTLSEQSKSTNHIESLEAIRRRRLLTISHLHPTDPYNCAQELSRLQIRNHKPIMCLDSTINSNNCERDPGAPVVLNGVLWGIMSSWSPDDCGSSNSAPTIVTLVSASNVSTWIYSTVEGYRWAKNEYIKFHNYGSETPKRIAHFYLKTLANH